MRSAANIWTSEEDARLAKMIGRHLSPQAIADAMGRTRNAVCGRAFRMKLHFTSKGSATRREPIRQRELARFTEVEDKIIIALAATGKSGHDIAEGINRHKSSVVKRARLLGAKLNGKDGPRPSAEPRAPAVKAAKVKLNSSNIAGKKESRTHDPVFCHRTPAVAVVPLMVALVDLGPDMCRFPVGDTRDEGFGFCGLSKDDGSAYCKAHRRLCHTAPEDRRRAA